ncbi:hypothetical protein N4P33_00535 [Streptomyces sp. 15-116A]|nr:hypothetical protein [Streptomyces sp. 15-116A]MCT7350676.1 hypothetical protein [Streptomyces sp. 15-116A]
MNSERYDMDRVRERRKAKGVALRVFFFVFFAYGFLYMVGMLGEQAQK